VIGERNGHRHVTAPVRPPAVAGTGTPPRSREGPKAAATPVPPALSITRARRCDPPAGTGSSGLRALRARSRAWSTAGQRRSVAVVASRSSKSPYFPN
jgi:hypothetical protein